MNHLPIIGAEIEDGWQALRHEWARTTDTWLDFGSHHFENHYWDPLSSMVAGYIVRVNDVAELVRQAESELNL